MSTKVYNAFKIKDPAKLWSVVNKIFREGRARVDAVLRAHYLHEVRHTDPTDKEYVKARAGSDARSEASFRLYRVRDKLRDRYKENTTRIDWDTYSLDVTVCFYPYKGECYVRTFCEGGSIFRNVLDFVEKMPELEDFHYQNQSDRPEGVSAKDWSNRCRVWNGISKENHDIGVHVDLDICSWSSFRLVDPWISMAQAWAVNPPSLPSREECWAENWKRNQTLHNITFGDGFIHADEAMVERENGVWWSTVEGRRKRHKDLNRAASHVDFEHQSESTKSLVRHLMAQAKEARAAKRKRIPK